MIDVAIIGAGISGAACARELMRYKLKVVVLERGYDVACGASRTNSGIVHGGYDPEPYTLKAHYNARGMRLIPHMAQELGFRYTNNGSMVVAFDEADLLKLKELMSRAKENGIEDVRLIDTQEALRLEPFLSKDVIGALVCPHSGIVDPFGMTVAYAENAADNGCEFRFNTAVKLIERRLINSAEAHTVESQSLKQAENKTDSEPEGIWHITCEDGTELDARCVINAAGVNAIHFHNLVSDNTLKSYPRKGSYVLMSRDMGSTFTHTVFQTPNAQGKGVLVSPTVEGNLIVGPDAQDLDRCDTSTQADRLDYVCTQATKTWPALSRREIIVNFAGVRPSGARGDFVIGQPTDAPGFFDIAAFDSPGLTSAPAVAQDVSLWVAQYLKAQKNSQFNPHRYMPARFLEMNDEERKEAIKCDKKFAHLICRCEQVSEAEVLACIHAPLPATTIVGIKRRCRAGTGRCQGGFCAPLIAEIIARETSIPLNKVCLAGPGTEVAPYRREETLPQTIITPGGLYE